MPTSLIFDIKRYAINDGPGIRVVIFFKGCNLHCAWCHNPESISAKAEKLYSPSKCIKCGSCVEACEQNAILLSADGIVTDNQRCVMCGKCCEACPALALEMSGKVMSVDEIITIIEKERVFFEQSGGGVTFSGGEPLLHSDLLIKLLEECGKRGIHRTVDTAGNVREETLLEVAKQTDLFLFDLKMMDSALHKLWTGSDNTLILQNLKKLAETGAGIIIRIPVIGGVNDSDENIEQTARFISELAGDSKEVQLLPYHNIAQNKYLKLGRKDNSEKLREPDKETLAATIEKFRQFGIKAGTGG
ncbi:MAG: glycyl-radical enzyme activating protein [Bacteroidetes bacterium HGW-Bacteroidetes-11]|nr:MAG: glycyl-radical enzyme activating protein [Bacteroidetes bacterium HGW-Bacteroidetes-11]